MTVTIQRLTTAKAMLGISRSTFYLHISQGLLPKPVQIGFRAVGWPSNELQAIVNARIAGQTDQQIKTLVSRIHAQRTNQAGV